MSHQTDVIVIGGGVVGLCAAHALRRAGREVTVLSRDPIGQGASAGNAGMIVPSHLIPLSAPGVVAQGLRWLGNPTSPFYIKPRLDLDLARWLLVFRRHCTARHVAHAMPILRDLSLASADAFAALQDDIGDVGYAQTGILMLYHTPKARQESLKQADQAEAAGLQVERLDAAALHALEPGLRTPAEGAVRYHQDGRIDPDALLHRLARALRADDVPLLEGVKVEALEARGDAVTAVRTAQGLFRARTIVLAAGAWTPLLARTAGLRVLVQPARGYSLTVPAPPGSPRLPMILADEKVTVTPMPGRLRFTGTLALAGFDPTLDARRIAPLRQLARAYLPDASDAEVEALAPWFGYRPCSPDGLPIIGPSPRYGNLIVATGHGMMGVTLAPITGRLVAAHVTGAAPPLDPVPLRVGRF